MRFSNINSSYWYTTFCTSSENFLPLFTQKQTSKESDKIVQYEFIFKFLLIQSKIIK